MRETNGRNSSTLVYDLQHIFVTLYFPIMRSRTTKMKKSPFASHPVEFIHRNVMLCFCASLSLSTTSTS